MSKTKLIVVLGPTASGKTSLAIALAKRYNGEIVSADSMQVYKHMSIGTAKPTIDEMDGIPHHMIDYVVPDCVFSVADYVASAHRIIADITARGKLPIVAGGTGLYITSLIDDVQFGNDTKGDSTVREELYAQEREHGGQYLYGRLEQVDPKSAEMIHPNNIPRVIRALEVYLQTGVTMSEHQRLSRLKESRYDALKIGISYKDRQKLYERINMRVDIMVEQGLIEETSAIMSAGFEGTAMQAIGYKELFAYLKGEQSLDESLDKLKQSTRRYAKRQLTWFRKDGKIHWFFPDEYENIQFMQKKIENTVDKFLNMCYDGMV